MAAGKHVAASSTATMPLRSALRSVEAGQRRDRTARALARRRAAFDDAKLEHVRDFDKAEPPSTVSEAPVYILASTSEIIRRRALARLENKPEEHTQAFHPALLPAPKTVRIDTASMSYRDLKAELIARRLPSVGDRKLLQERLELHLAKLAADHDEQEAAVEDSVVAGDNAENVHHNGTRDGGRGVAIGDVLPARRGRGRGRGRGGGGPG